MGSSMKIGLFVCSIVFSAILIVETSNTETTRDEKTINGTTSDQKPTDETTLDGKTTNGTTLDGSTLETSAISSTITTITTEATTRKAPVQWPNYHPIYRYSCNEDLSVTFKGVDGIIEYVPAINKTDNCTISQIAGHHGNIKISKECLSSMSFQEVRWIQVAVYDKNEGETLPTTTHTTSTTNTTNNDTNTSTPTTRTSLQLITGHHIFNLTCLPLDEDGVDRIALAETGITDIEQLHHVYNEIGQVEMRFKEGESLDKPDLSEVFIGDRFYMYLKYMGDTEDYIIVPQTCTAYKGNFRTNIGHKLELWKQR